MEEILVVVIWLLTKITIIDLIRKVFKEGFTQQEKNISNLISGNFSITKQQIKEVKKEVLDLRKSKHRIHREPTGRKSKQCWK